MSLEEIVKKDIKTIEQAISGNLNGIRLVTFNTVKGELSRRIFQQGVSSDGSAIGQYAPSTKKQRERGGRQTSKVDLEMTGTLRNALIVGKEGNQIAMGIRENQEPKISVAGGVVRITGKSDFSTVENAIQQEQNFGKDIFAPTDNEVQTGEKVFLHEIHRVTKKALGNKTYRIRK